MSRSRSKVALKPRTPAELADEALRLKELGLNGTQIGKALDRSKKYVNNLMRTRTQLAPALLPQFESGELSVTQASLLVKYDHAEQVRRHEAGGEQISIGKSQVRELLRRVRASGKSEAWRDGARAALRCALGELETAALD